MNCQKQTQIAEHVNADNQACAEHSIIKKANTVSNKFFMPASFDSCSLSVARCELNNLADCTSNGLAVGVSHIGGDTRCSVLTIHKMAPDRSYGVIALNIKIKWDVKNSTAQFKQAIIAARKVICEHNKLLKASAISSELKSA